MESDAIRARVVMCNPEKFGITPERIDDCTRFKKSNAERIGLAPSCFARFRPSGDGLLWRYDTTCAREAAKTGI